MSNSLNSREIRTVNSSISFGHDPVMAAEIVEVFAPVPHGVIVDATLGGAGHTVRLLNAYPWMRVLGIDQDPIAIAHGRKLASEHAEIGDRLMIEQGRFDEMPAMLGRCDASHKVSVPPIDKPITTTFSTRDASMV